MEITLSIILIIAFLCLCGIVAYKEFINIPKNILNFKESVELVGVPIVTFYCGSTKLHFILDSGATGNVIDSKVLKNLNKDYYSKTDFRIEHYGLEGNVEFADLVSINFSYGDLSFTDIFNDIDMSNAFNKVKEESGVNIHGLLGSNFLTKYKYILDFDKMIFYNKK